MKDTVIIKVYRNEITNSDYHDMCIDEFNLKIKELKTFAESIGKKVYFTVCKALDCADFDCFAEIAYSGTLTEQEKYTYISIIKSFAQDANVERKGMEIYDLPLSIIFKKAQIETL